MEQNNNNDNKAMDTIKNTVKDVTKNEAKKVVGKIFIKILPYIGIFFLCLLAVGLVIAVGMTILNFFKGLFGLDKQSATSTLNQANQMVSLTSRGYELNDDYSKKIIEKLQALKVNTDAMGFTSEEAESIDSEGVDPENVDTLDDMIDKYIKAEVKTMYPSIGKKGDVDGLVKIVRMSAENGETKTMSYKPYDEFMGAFNSSNVNDNILDCFTINPDNFKMYIATYKKTIYYDCDASGNKVKKSEQSVIEPKELDYQTLIQSYGTPLNFFISMHLITGNKSFMNELVNMVNGENELELTFIETTDKEYIQVDYEGEVKITTSVSTPVISADGNENAEDDGAAGEAEEDGESSSVMDELDKDVTVEMPDITEDNEMEITYETKTTEETRPIHTGNISEFSEDIEPKQYIVEKIYSDGYLKVTKANTWRLKSNLKIQKNEPIKSYIQENEITLPNPDLEHTVIINRKEGESGDIIQVTRSGYIDEITNEWTESYSISVTETDKGYEITEFMELIKKYPKVKNNLETSPSLLFYLLEQNENTQELAGLMKYIIYNFTGIDYGITDLDEVFKLQNFNSVGGLYYGSTVEEKLWWALIDAGYSNKYAVAGAMGNIQAESGFNSMSVQKDYTKPNPEQYRLDYTSKVDNGTISEDDFVNHGPDGGGYGLAQWTFHSRKQGLYDYAKDVLKCSIGDVNMQIEYLLAEMSLAGGAEGKTTCQFLNVEAEGKLWTRDTWLNATSASEAAKAYSYSFEGPGVYNSERAVYAEELYEKYKDAERPSTAIAIIQAADYIHQYMEELQYTYCVYDNNDYEECHKKGKTHGLNSTFEASKTGYHNTCCATFVSWVLQEAGCISNNLHSDGANELANNLENKAGWIRVGISDAQPGDVLCKDHHVEIYAGDGTSYNAGSGNAIRGAAPAKTNINKFSYALRAPN